MKNTRIQRLLDDLQKAAARRKITKVEIARQADLHPNTLRHFRGYRSEVPDDKPAWNPTPEVIAKIERVLLPQLKRKRP